jgi:SAM-dependent methyltransferase
MAPTRTATAVDRLSHAWYTTPGAIHGLAGQQGFTDAGERTAYWRIADEMRGRRILDIGVGPGRTVTLLRALSKDYVGIDYVPAMVETARRNCPFADIRQGDARDLQGFADASVDLVVFSYHGIDTVDHADRPKVLAEARRVLVPGGVFWFSTLNVEGPALRYRPWKPPPPRRPQRWFGWLRYAAELLPTYLRTLPLTPQYLRCRRLSEHGDGWAVTPFFAGGWSLLNHAITLRRQLDDLAAAGFAAGVEAYEDAGGRPVRPGDTLDPVFSFNLLARKP